LCYGPKNRGCPKASPTIELDGAAGVVAEVPLNKIEYFLYGASHICCADILKRGKDGRWIAIYDHLIKFRSILYEELARQTKLAIVCVCSQ